MLYYFRAYTERVEYDDYFYSNNGCELYYHCLTRIKKQHTFSGTRGEFIAQKDDYILWTRETNNILIQ